MTDAPAIQLQNVRFGWTRGAPAIIDIEDLTVRRGEAVFIRGPSGSGKTTLLNLIGGVVVPDSGSVRVLGSDLGAMSGSARDRFRADHIGFVFQLFNLISYLGLIENVTLPCQFSAARRARATAVSGSLRAEARRLLGMMRIDEDDLAGRAVSQLSVGQQQRVAVARALIGTPDLIIADEPTSSLDADATEAFLALLFEEVSLSGAALVFVSHDQTLERHFDRTVVLSDVNRAAVRG